jgi:mono/diheme cytochrome c family protein
MNARHAAGIAAITAVAVLAGLAGCALFESEQVAKGRKLFAYYCMHCHGEKGQGNGFNAKRLDPKARDLTDKDEEFMGKLSNEEIYEVISRDMMSQEEFDEKYGEDTDKLFTPPNMPSFKNTLSDEERWSLVAFVRTLHKNTAPKVEIPAKAAKERPKFTPVPKPTLVSAPADLEKLAEKGKTIYEERYGCHSCHAIGDSGGIVGPELDRAGFRLNAAWVYRWIKYPQAMKPGTKMPNLGVSDDDALAITAYLGTLRAAPPSGEPVAAPKKVSTE